MRELTINEKKIINTLLEHKEKGNVVELQVMRLLRKYLDSFAIAWELHPRPVVTFYNSENKNEEELCKNYYGLCDFIYFIDELVESKYLAIQNSPTTQHKRSRLLYDKDLYTYDEKNKIFWYNDNYEDKRYALKIHKTIDFNIDIANRLEVYADSIIYPLPLLKDLHDHKYMSVEKQRYKKQFCQTRWAIIITAICTILTGSKCFMDIIDRVLIFLGGLLPN